MNFSTAISTCLAKYANFEGRASRSEFWWFYLFVYLLNSGHTIFGYIILGELASNIISFSISAVFLFPMIAVTARRLHDIGRSGWWQLIAFTIIGVIVLFVWLAKETEKSPNEYGEPAIA